MKKIVLSVIATVGLSLCSCSSDDNENNYPSDKKVEGLCPDSHHPHVIDMGKAGKWACCDLGASTPWDKGNTYFWGGEESHWKIHHGEQAKYTIDYHIGYNIAGTQYDAAYMLWGNNWCTPDYSQLSLLVNNCSVENITIKGVRGLKFTSSNGGAIFFRNSFYWSSTLASSGNQAWCLVYGRLIESDRYSSQTCIRPVKSESEIIDPAVEVGLCPDAHHPHTIDLGDVGRWSCCNLGASAPWELGDYYAWGETKTKNSYTWKNYEYKDYNDVENESACLFLSYDISGTKYDVAHVKLGNKWCMPKSDQLELLVNKCSHEWICLKDLFGVKITAPNGNSIFLPATGSWSGDWLLGRGLDNIGKSAEYRSSTLFDEIGNGVRSPKYNRVISLFIKQDKDANMAYLQIHNYFTDTGSPVRPISK